MRFKLFLKLLFSCCFALALIGCQNSDDPNRLRVGIIAGPDSVLMETVQEVALQKYKLALSITEFEDYSMPNRALGEGQIDVNVFQHRDFLETTNAHQDYNLVAIANTFIMPMGIYSRTLKTLDELPSGAKVGIPSDPSNQARALFLLQAAKLITLNDTKQPMIADVHTNTKALTLIEIDASQLPRSLDDLGCAVINSNYAIASGLSPKHDAIHLEQASSASRYANVVVVQKQYEHDPRIQAFVSAYHDEAVVKKAEELYKGNAVVAW